MKTIIAIDPGKSGGIAGFQAGFETVKNDVGEIAARFVFHPTITSCAMPQTEGDVLTLLRATTESAILSGDCRVAYIEKVGGYVGRSKGRKEDGEQQGQPGSAMFKFGRGVGHCIGVLQTLDWRIIEVTPQVWQKALSLGTRGSMTKTEWRNKKKAEAQRLYPGQAVTLATADALLILEYARRKEGGQ